MPLTAGLTPCRVLHIDDDTELTGLLGERLRRDGIEVLHASTGGMGLDMVGGRLRAVGVPPVLVLLDLMLPDMTGIEVFRRLRERSPALPIIMLTAKGDPVDRVVGLELGADDYVAKPFDPRELSARIRAVLRRAAPAKEARTPTAPEATRWMPPTVTLDAAGRTITSKSASVSLTTIEFKLLDVLARHPGQVLSRDYLTQSVQVGDYQPLDRAVDVQVARLRRKLRAADRTTPWIVTARGEGYVWVPVSQGA